MDKVDLTKPIFKPGEKVSLDELRIALGLEGLIPPFKKVKKTEEENNHGR